MLISPDYYLDEIKKYNELDNQKQLNMIRYAKCQITYYQNLINGKFDNNVAKYINVDPGPDAYLWWWKQVLELMKIKNIILFSQQYKSFEIMFGGFFIGTSRIIINFEKNFFCANNSFNNNVYYPLNDIQLLELNELINLTQKWNKKYINQNLLDGYSWEIKINDKTVTYGVNSIPPNYNKLINKLYQILEFEKNAIAINLKP